MDTQNKIVVFESKQVRRVWHEEEWWYAVIDAIEILTESTNPAVYWRVLKKRLKDEGSDQTVTKCNALKLPASAGKALDTYEVKSGDKVVSAENFKAQIEAAKSKLIGDNP